MPKKPSNQAPKGGKAAKPAKPPARAAKSSDPEFEPAMVQAISLAVYKERLGAPGVANVLAEPNGEARLLSRSIPYNTITRAYLRVMKSKGLLK